MLTQEQMCSIANKNSLPWYSYQEYLEAAFTEVYAAGMAAGEAKERERADRCDKLMEKLMRHPRPY